MSRKNKTLRAFLHQTRNPTIEQAWDAAWKHAQKTFHARSMQDMEGKLVAAQAECEKLRKDVAALVEGIARCRHQASYFIGNEEALKNQLSTVRYIANEVLIGRGAQP